MHARARAQRALKRMQRRPATVATRLRVPHPRCELGIERGESISLGKATPRVWTPAAAPLLLDVRVAARSAAPWRQPTDKRLHDGPGTKESTGPTSRRKKILIQSRKE